MPQQEVFDHDVKRRVLRLIRIAEMRATTRETFAGLTVTTCASNIDAIRAYLAIGQRTAARIGRLTDLAYRAQHSAECQLVEKVRYRSKARRQSGAQS